MGAALKPKVSPLDKNGRHLSVVIYWHPRDKPDALANGHAALIIDADRWLNAPKDDQSGELPPYFYNTSWYVSWVGGKIDWKPVKGSKKGGSKGIANDFCADSIIWGGEQVSEVYPYSEMRWPVRWVAIEGLDTQAMFAAWYAARNKEGGHWRLFDKNCATMLHTILKAGGGDDLATGHKKQLVWWPSDLIRYARSMTGHVVKDSNSPQAAFL
jgi:hypothetical protein